MFQRLTPALFLVAALTAQDDPGTTFAYRIPVALGPIRAAALEAGFDLAHGRANDPDLLVYVLPGAEHDAFLRLFPEAQLVARGSPYAGGGGLDVPDAAYYTTAEIVAEIDALVLAHPTLARRVDVTTLPGAARTHANQSIWALVVSDSVTQAEDEPAVLLAAQHHARELNSPHMVLRAAQRVLAGHGVDPALTALVDETELWFVPCVNPDGVDHVWNVDQLWRKNRRNNGANYGVDPNRNYPTHWGACGSSTTTSSETYRGPSAGSEPEVRSMRALVASIRPEIYLDFHSYGQQVLFPYAPCTTAGATVQAFLDRYVDDLRAPMSYGRRLPSASGEAPEDHWTSSGTLSFLIEVGTAFQPAFATTVAEEARVWPGIRRALTAWRPALRGHVRSVRFGTPLEATLTYTPATFSYGEVTRSRAGDGRYALWLPLGTWQVTATAPGHDSVTRSVTVTTLDTPQTFEFELMPSLPPATLTKSGSERVGTAVTLTYTAPGDAGRTYWIPLSAGTVPGFAIGNRLLPLNADGLMELSLGATPLLAGNLGVLPGNAQGVATLNIPPLPAIVGVAFFAGGITFETGYAYGIERWAPPVPIVIQP
ncbi:MAG: hypothetical protein IT457_12550 [Planctomycetes bacterium]|nr:hypothetical protein [Planctomycetota bacterium]